MNDVVTVLVAFVFVCIIFPRLVRDRTYFYLALSGIVLVLLIDCLVGVVAGATGLVRFLMVIRGLSVLGSFVLLVVSAGGMSIGELIGEFGGAMEALRNPESHKPTIVPVTGEKPRPRETEEPERKPYVINDPVASAPKSDPDEKIPLE